MLKFFSKRDRNERAKSIDTDRELESKSLIECLEENMYRKTDEDEEYTGEFFLTGTVKKRKLIYEKGELKRGIEYLDNKVMEDITFYREKKIKLWISNYPENSFVKEYYEDGKKKRICQNENGRIKSETKYEYYENGKIKSIVSYEDGRKGYIKISKIGKVAEKKLVKNTKVITTEYDNVESFYQDENYDLNVELRDDREYVINIKDAVLYTGKFMIEIFDDETEEVVKVEQSYKDGLADGEWSYYTLEGELLRKEIYSMGDRICI